MGAHHKHVHPINAALLLTCFFALVEAIGGWMTNSLALLADAIHMFSDVAALLLAATAEKIASRPAHAGMTYGYGRARVIAAQFNGFGLWFLAGWIVWEAMGRFTSPPDVQGDLLTLIASLGLVANLVILHWLRGGENLNVKAAFWHVMGDTLGSIAALGAGIVILLTGWMAVDPLLSIVVSVILAWGGWRLVKETMAILMEATPSALSVNEVGSVIRMHSGVKDVHHIHVWTLPDGRFGLSAHVVVRDMRLWSKLLPQLQESLANIGVEHATLQPEEDHHCS